MKRLKRKKITVGDVIRTILMVFFALVFVTCAIYLGMYAYQSYRNRQSGQLAVDQYAAGETADSPMLERPEGVEVSEEVWDKMQFLNVDFDALQAANSDVCGWIQVSGLDVINYPLVWREDNDYYLSHTWDGKDSRYGAIFLDKNCSDDLRDPYTLIYGHNMKDGSMFGRLKKYRDAEFYQENGGLITIYLPDRTCIYQIFSVRQVAADASSVYTLGYVHDDAFGEYLQYMADHSLYDTGVPVSKDDTVITLSTCAGSDRLVLHAKLLTTYLKEEGNSVSVQ